MNQFYSKHSNSLNGVLEVPGDKSISQRALILGSMTIGKTKIHGISFSDDVSVSKRAYNTHGSRMFIEINSKVKLEDLLLGVIVQSGNDASVALAEHISGSEEVFVNLMNQHALNLGMKNTQFANSTGMPAKDAEHSTTAYDLAILSRALISNYPEIYEMHKIKEFTYGTKSPIKQYNRNKLLWRDLGHFGTVRIDNMMPFILFVQQLRLYASFL